MVPRPIPQRGSERRCQRTPRFIRSRVDRYEPDSACDIATITQYRTGNQVADGRIGHIDKPMQTDPFAGFGHRRVPGRGEACHPTETTVLDSQEHKVQAETLWQAAHEQRKTGEAGDQLQIRASVPAADTGDGMHENHGIGRIVLGLAAAPEPGQALLPAAPSGANLCQFFACAG